MIVTVVGVVNMCITRVNALYAGGSCYIAHICALLTIECFNKLWIGRRITPDNLCHVLWARVGATMQKTLHMEKSRKQSLIYGDSLEKEHMSGG